MCAKVIISEENTKQNAFASDENCELIINDGNLIVAVYCGDLFFKEKRRQGA